ncbi:MAG: hypothetical protein KBG15_16535 [Kofleriaceae bacterium]|nr:hypothetical protein [Kofleriaceae bacterium]
MTMYSHVGPLATALAAEDEWLIARVRDLAIVDFSVLQHGLDSNLARDMLMGFADDALQALLAAQARSVALRATMAKLDVGAGLLGNPRARKSGDGRVAGERIADALKERASLARAAARFDEVCAGLWPRLLAAERQVG